MNGAHGLLIIYMYFLSHFQAISFRCALPCMDKRIYMLHNHTIIYIYNTCISFPISRQLTFDVQFLVWTSGFFCPNLQHRIISY